MAFLWDRGTEVHLGSHDIPRRSHAWFPHSVAVAGAARKKGAEPMIADFQEIGHIQLSADATPQEYLMKYLNNWFVGVEDTLTFGDSVEFEVRDSTGNVITRG